MLFYLSALVEYKSLSGKTLQESIEREMSGRMEEILVAIGDYKVFLVVFKALTSPHKMHKYFQFCLIVFYFIFYCLMLNFVLVKSN